VSALLLSLLTAPLGSLKGGVGRPDRDVRLGRLARERASLDSRLVQSPRFKGYDRLFSMLEAQFCEALYPLGVSSRRYVFAHPSAGGPCFLVFQRMIGARAENVWFLPLDQPESLKAPTRGAGTLRLFLGTNGARIRARRLTPAQRSALDARVEFADYHKDPLGGALSACLVRRDGTRSEFTDVAPDPSEAKPGFLPIVAEESARLGYGPSAWLEAGRYTISHPHPER